MRIHVDQIKDSGLLLSYAEPAESFSVLSQLERDDECHFLTRIATRLQVTRISDMVKVDGELKTSVRLACDRCLNEFETDLESVFTLTYCRDVSDEPDGEDEVELSPEDLGLLAFHGEQIDFRQAIEEQVVLALPLRNLCSEDCKGLCPQCGADLNLTGCTCAKVVPAGKFAALRELKLKQ